MEVILLKDVKSLGKKDQIVKVNDGYARNYILPNKIGLEANAKNLNDLKLQKKRNDKEEALLLEQAKEYAAKIAKKPVQVTVKCGEGGRIFGSVSTKEIAQEVKTQLGFEIDKKKMQLQEPIKALGTYNVPVKCHKDVTATLVVKVSEAKE